MKYYIDKVNTWSPANRKCLEVQSFVKEFRQTLVHDDAAVESLMKELREKVEVLNERYPRTKRLMVKKNSNWIGIVTEERKFEDGYVASFTIERVRQVYKTLEAMMDEREKGGEE
jgi:hypothetical protein